MKYLKDNMTEIKELPKTGKTDLRLQDLLALCLSHWKWFVISLIFTMSLAVLYILRTPPQYTRTSVILIKDNTNKNDVGTMAAAMSWPRLSRPSLSSRRWPVCT